LTKAYYRKKVEDLTFIPVTINYTRTLEGETFPIELTGQDKVKESLGRLVKAVEIFSMNLGSIYLDFCEPIVFSQFNVDQVKANPKMNPDLNEKDRKKRLKIEWKSLSEAEKLKWASRKKQKKDISTTKLKIKTV
jgi:glycerone phosphate O-acyltransferase/fatty acyl-CoA reductase